MDVKIQFKQTCAFTARNIRLFFKDKGAFISALIVPIMILLLYVLFLHSVLKSAFAVNLPKEFVLSEDLINGYVASYETSSILAVCCITVAFVANMCMVDDRVTGVGADLLVTPAGRSVFVLGYYFSTAIVTLAVCYVAMLAGFAYIACMGWQMGAPDVLGVMLDVFLTCMFGTALSSIVCYFLKSRGAINAVSTIVSSTYGFISGAYYPISQFSSGIANFVMCLPGTYCTGLLRSHFMLPFESAFADAGMPAESTRLLLTSLDAYMNFFDNAVPVWVMYTVAACAVIVCVGLFAALNVIKIKKKRKDKNA